MGNLRRRGLVGWLVVVSYLGLMIQRLEGGRVGFDDMRFFFFSLPIFFYSIPGSVSNPLFSLEYPFSLCIDLLVLSLGSLLLLGQEEK